MWPTDRGTQHATPTEVTLLDLVWAVGQYTTSEVEIVATVTSLVNTGQIRLCGNFAGATINLAVPTFATPQACKKKKVASPFSGRVAFNSL